MSVQREFLSGDTDRFAFKIAFQRDPNKAEAATPENALSWGSFQLWVDGQNLCKQVPRSLRRNALPVELINRALLMGPEHVACALVKLMQIRKTPSGADRVFHDAPEAFDGI